MIIYSAEKVLVDDKARGSNATVSDIGILLTTFTAWHTEKFKPNFILRSTVMALLLILYFEPKESNLVTLRATY